MFIIKLWRFIVGYLVVTVQGRAVERLLNLAVTRGVGFWDLNRHYQEARFCVTLASFKQLRPLVRKTRCRLHIERKVGLPFWRIRMRRRRALVAGACFFLAALYVLSSFVWFIDIKGDHYINEEEVVKLARRLGIRPGTWKRKLNLPALEEEMARLHGDIAWVGMKLRGVLLEIEIVEHIPEPEQDTRPGDLVASKDGLVEKVLVVEGEAEVVPGDTVSKGDVLIRGIKSISDSIVPEEELPPPEPVRARGEVEARVWYEERVELPEKRIISSSSGESSNTYVLIWNGNERHLWGRKEVPYDFYRQEIRKWSFSWRNLALPVELVVTTYHELLVEETPLSHEEALELARAEALKKLQEQIPEEVALERFFCEEYSEDSTEWIRAVAETREDIAEFKYRQPD